MNNQNKPNNSQLTNDQQLKKPKIFTGMSKTVINTEIRINCLENNNTNPHMHPNKGTQHYLNKNKFCSVKCLHPNKVPQCLQCPKIYIGH